MTGYIKLGDLKGEGKAPTAPTTDFDAQEAPGPMTAALLLPAVQQLALDHFEFNETAGHPYCVDSDPVPAIEHNLLASEPLEPEPPAIFGEPIIAEFRGTFFEPGPMEDALF
ncbi:MAG: hypothetical protein AAGI13_00690 [Pseudomonadota bacterium]